MQARYPADVSHLEEAIESINAPGDDLNEATLNSVLDNQSITEILHQFDMSLSGLRDGSNGDLAAFWM